jgi:hypothetical protein
MVKYTLTVGGYEAKMARHGYKAKEKDEVPVPKEPAKRNTSKMTLSQKVNYHVNRYIEKKKSERDYGKKVYEKTYTKAKWSAIKKQAKADAERKFTKKPIPKPSAGMRGNPLGDFMGFGGGGQSRSEGKDREKRVVNKRPAPSGPDFDDFMWGGGR